MSKFVYLQHGGKGKFVPECNQHHAMKTYPTLHMMISFTSLSLNAPEKDHQYPLNRRLGRLQIWPGRGGREINI